MKRNTIKNQTQYCNEQYDEMKSLLSKAKNMMMEQVEEYLYQMEAYLIEYL